MFELRWAWGPACNCAKQNSEQSAYRCGCSRCGQMERVLQYREVVEKWHGAGAGYETATQWRDVPTVTEQETPR